MLLLRLKQNSLRPAIALSLLTLICVQLSAQAKDKKSLVDESLPERPLVVCLGDSLTAHGYPQEMQKLLHVRVVNAGVGGNTSRQGLARLEKDVLKRKPDVVVFFFGTNDSRRDHPGAQVGLEEYRTNVVTILERCQSIGAKVLLGVSPPIVAEAYFQRHPETNYVAVGGFKTYVDKYRETVRSIGKEKNVPVVDLNVALQKYPNWVTEDGVHPTDEGNKIFAQLIAEKVRPLLDRSADKK